MGDSIHGNIILRATYEPSSILPKPWRKMVASSGTTFYRNSETNVFQTNKPKGTVAIAGRKEKDQNTKGKIIASSLPILAFDDNPIDWEFFQNGKATGQECILAMAPKHYSGDDLEKKLARLRPKRRSRSLKERSNKIIMIRV